MMHTEFHNRWITITSAPEDFHGPVDWTGAPLLLPSLGTQLRAGIDRWLDKNRIHPQIIAEFDDSALMKAFGREGVGIFSAPAARELLFTD